MTAPRPGSRTSCPAPCTLNHHPFALRVAPGTPKPAVRTWGSWDGLTFPAIGDAVRIGRISRRGDRRAGSRTGRSRADVVIRRSSRPWSPSGCSSAAWSSPAARRDRPEAGPEVLHDGFETPQPAGSENIPTRRSTCSPRIGRAGRRTTAGSPSGSSSRPMPAASSSSAMPLPKVPVTETLEVGLYVRAEPVGRPALRPGRPAGGHRSGDAGPVVRPDPGDDLRSGRSLAAARAHQHAADDRAAGPGAAGLVAAAGEPEGGLPRSAGGQPDGRARGRRRSSSTTCRSARSRRKSWPPGRSRRRRSSPTAPIGRGRRTAPAADRTCRRSGSRPTAWAGSAPTAGYHDWLPTAIDAPGADVVRAAAVRVRRPGRRPQVRPRADQDGRRARVSC